MQQRDTFQTEQAHLKDTLQILFRESDVANEHAATMSQRVEQLKLASGGTYSNDLIVAQNLNARLHILARSLQLAKGSPYFTRVDFCPDGEETSSWYIGKHGIPNGEGVAVVDWRSPLANLYYGGTMGRTDYEAPDGTIHGELLLKRNFTIEDGQLKAMLDADVAGADALLLETLSQMTSDTLREVVSTLQAEQNRIIRYPLTEPLVVQGVAGSGKTTIMLHRIAYLLYTYSKRLAPENLLILAPNPLFLGYISSVLPDLGVDNVVQTTWAQLAAQLLDKRAPRLLPENRPDDLSAEDAATLERICHFKGSQQMANLIDRFLDEYTHTLLPSQGIALGPISILTLEQMQTMFLHDMAPFPLARRLQELIKWLRSRLKDARKDAEELLRNAATQRADRIIASCPDTPERKARLQKLYASAQQRVEELDLAAEQLKKNLPRLFAAPSLMEVYTAFLAQDPQQLSSLSSEEKETFLLMSQHTLPYAQKKSAEHEDLAPLLWMARRLFGFENKPRIAHVVIDEAQDMPPLALQFLQHVFHATYTLVGDMAQGIYRYRGL